MKKVRTATFNNTAYNIGINGQIQGLAEHPQGSKPWIDIIAKQHTQRELEVIIHECLHAEDWSKSDEIVDRISRDIGKLLWRLGYRRPKTKS